MLIDCCACPGDQVCGGHSPGYAQPNGGWDGPNSESASLSSLQSAPRGFRRGGHIDMGAQEQPTAEKSSGAAIAAMPRRSSSPFYLARAAAARATVALAKPQSQREAQSPLLAKLQTEEEAQLPLLATSQSQQEAQSPLPAAPSQSSPPLPLPSSPPVLSLNLGILVDAAAAAAVVAVPVATVAEAVEGKPMLPAPASSTRSSSSSSVGRDLDLPLQTCDLESGGAAKDSVEGDGVVKGDGVTGDGSSRAAAAEGAAATCWAGEGWWEWLRARLASRHTQWLLVYALLALVIMSTCAFLFADEIGGLWQEVSGSSTMIFIVATMVAWPYTATSIVVATVLRFGCSLAAFSQAAELVVETIRPYLPAACAPSTPDRGHLSSRAHAERQSAGSTDGAPTDSTAVPPPEQLPTSHRPTQLTVFPVEVKTDTAKYYTLV